MPTDSAAPSSMEAWLLQRGILTASEAKLARREGERLGHGFSEIVQRLGLVTSAELAEYRSDRGQLSQATAFISQEASNDGHLSLRRLVLDADLRTALPVDLCQTLSVIPVSQQDGILWVASANPFDLPTHKRLESAAKCAVETLPASETDIRLALNRNFGEENSLYDAVGAFIEMDASELDQQSQDDPPMIRLAEQILMHAATQEASDIHLHPEERFFRVRLRVDGVLEEGLLLPGAIRKALTSRFKIIAGLDTAEDRLPQDGRINFTIGSESIDVRVSTLPGCHGESVVMRLLDQSRVKLDLDKLGFSPDQKQAYGAVIEQPHGVFLITGPTGSGKTTTLYTLLGMVDAESRSIFTLEDPIEYQLPLVRQTQVREEIGMSFERGLRSLLRQDPDVILVGETRDSVTAELMVRAALTGHLVFSTLHTNDAISAIPRLTDLGIPPFLLSSSLLGLSAQRLARRLCPVCKQAHSMPAAAWKALGGQVEPGVETVQVYQSGSCAACGGKGYSGRICLSELIHIDAGLRKQIDRGMSTTAMKPLLRQQGTQFMRQDGLNKVLAGLTTVEEVAFAVPLEEEESEPHAEL